jgi:hypothetical protein
MSASGVRLGKAALFQWVQKFERLATSAAVLAALYQRAMNETHLGDSQMVRSLNQ